MADLTGAAVRARIVPASAHQGDEPLTIDPSRDGGLEVLAEGRAVLVRPPAGARAAARRSVVLAPRPAADAVGPRIVEVVVDGWRFEIEVEPERRAALREKAGQGPATSANAGSADLRAIIPGRVVAVSVAVGDEVAAGQQILVVEAMKMQNEVRAPLAGTVERVAVGEGQTIERGELLAVIGGRASDARVVESSK